MGDAALLKTGLGRYGALWLGSFLLVLIGAAIAVLALGMDLIDLADLVLPIALIGLSAAVVLGLVLAVVSPASLGAKCLLTFLALLLILPLLWSPVLAVLVVATISGTVIEYSTAYAHFRIAVSQLIYPVVSLMVEGPLVAAVWNAFQVVASIVGFVASALQIWRVLKPMLANTADEA